MFFTVLTLHQKYNTIEVTAPEAYYDADSISLASKGSSTKLYLN